MAVSAHAGTNTNVTLMCLKIQNGKTVDANTAIATHSSRRRNDSGQLDREERLRFDEHENPTRATDCGLDCTAIVRRFLSLHGTGLVSAAVPTA